MSNGIVHLDDDHVLGILNNEIRTAYVRKSRLKDFSPLGMRLDGPFENDRNADAADCFKAVLREAYGVKDVICAHHLVYVREETRQDGFAYQIVQEIPSADALIFDHAIAKKIWGDAWRDRLTMFACEPVETRDELFARMYMERA